MTEQTEREELARLIWESSIEFSSPGSRPATQWADVQVSAARQLARATADALLAAGYRKTPEPEYEYAVKAEGDDEPWSDYSTNLDYIADSTRSVWDANDVLVKRRAPGEWEPVS